MLEQMHSFAVSRLKKLPLLETYLSADFYDHSSCHYSIGRYGVDLDGATIEESGLKDTHRLP